MDVHETIALLTKRYIYVKECDNFGKFVCSEKFTDDFDDLMRAGIIFTYLCLKMNGKTEMNFHDCIKNAASNTFKKKTEANKKLWTRNRPTSAD